jgi:hypothetical protein
VREFDLIKRVLQVHALDCTARVLLAKAMSPEPLFAWRGGCPHPV